MDTSFNPNTHRSWSEGSPHAISIQDLLDHGKATPTKMKEVQSREYKVYRPTIGFYGNVYLTDDFGNSIQVPKKSVAHINYFLFGELHQWTISESSSTCS